MHDRLCADAVVLVKIALVPMVEPGNADMGGGLGGAATVLPREVV